MSRKTLIYTCIAVFGFIGGLVGSKLDSDVFGMWGILGSTLGGFLGIWVAVKLTSD